MRVRRLFRPWSIGKIEGISLTQSIKADTPRANQVVRLDWDTLCVREEMSSGGIVALARQLLSSLMSASDWSEVGWRDWR